MLGLFAMGLTFMRGAAVITILGVLMVLLANLTLFPALLGYLGKHIDRFRLPFGRGHQVQVAEGGHVEPSRGWLAWSRFVDRHRWLAALTGLGLLLVIASPFLAVHFGFPDAGNNREATSTRQAYDMLGEGFGAGMNGPLLLVAEVPAGSAADALDGVTAAVAGTGGVAAVSPATLNPAGDTAIITVLPTTGPQAQQTEDLVTALRDDVLPQATAGTDVVVHVGGVTATSIDSTHNISKRLPLLIGGVVLLSMLLLIASFRSLAVAVKAAVMNLLSVAAAYGVVALVLQGGWAGQLVGIDTPTPLPAFVPVLMFAVLFGLSMDYEVFLVSRMREGWLRTGDNEQAILGGLAGHRPGDHRCRGDHGGGLRGLHPVTGRRPQGHRRRHGGGDLHRRLDRPAAAGARGHVPAGARQLVDARVAGPAAAGAARRGSPRGPPAGSAEHVGPGRQRLTR